MGHKGVRLEGAIRYGKPTDLELEKLKEVDGISNWVKIYKVFKNACMSESSVYSNGKIIERGVSLW